MSPTTPYQVSLPNGNQLIILPDDKASSVGLAVVLDGSREEPKRLVAHTTEHLMSDKGVYSTPTQFGMLLDDRALDFNAEIGKETTMVYFRFFLDNIESGFSIAENLILRPRFSKRLFRERHGMQVEQMAGEDTLEGMIPDLADETVYIGHPALATRLVGSREELERVTVEDVQQWHQHLISGPITIAVTGQIDPAVALRLAKRKFGRTERSRETIYTPFRSRQNRLMIRTVRWPIQLIHITVAIALPFGLGHAHRLLLSALNNHLGERRRASNRLALRIVGDNDLRWAYSAHSTVWNHRECGILSVTTEVVADHVEPVLRMIADELNRLREVKLTSIELGLAKKWLTGLSAERHEDTVRTACFYGEQAHIAGSPITHSEFCERVEREVTAENIQRLARGIVRRDRTSVILVGPTQRLRRARIAASLDAL